MTASRAAPINAPSAVAPATMVAESRNAAEIQTALPGATLLMPATPGAPNGQPTTNRPRLGPRIPPVLIGHHSDAAEHDASRMATGAISGRIVPPSLRPGQAGISAPASFVQGLASRAPNRGTYLPSASHGYFDTRYAGLGDVRIHTDSAASALATSIDARAFTIGRDVYFAPGQYDPSSRSGFRLLAHELAHVAQYRGADHNAPRMVRREGWTESAGKWYDEQKWAIYRGMIKGLKSAKGSAVNAMRSQLAHIPEDLRGAVSGLIDVVDFVIDMIIALLLVIIGMAVGFSEGIVGLVTGLIGLCFGLLKMVANLIVAVAGKPEAFKQDCIALEKALRNLLPGLKMVIDAWIERYKKATLEEQVLMGGELIGQIEAFIATFALAGAKAGQATTIVAPVNMASKLAPAQAMVRAVAITVPAVVPKTAAEAAVVSTQMMMMSNGSGGGGGSGSGGGSGKLFPGLNDAEVDKAIAEAKPHGDLIELGEYGGASENRKALGIAGSDARQAPLAKPPANPGTTAGPAAHREALQASNEGAQAMHGAPRSVMKHVRGYNADQALTWLMPRSAHFGMDAFWKESFQAMQAAGKSEATAMEIHDIVAESIRRAPNISPMQRNAFIARLHDEMFLEFALKPDQVMKLPYAR